LKRAPCAPIRGKLPKVVEREYPELAGLHDIIIPGVKFARTCYGGSNASAVTSSIYPTSRGKLVMLDRPMYVLVSAAAHVFRLNNVWPPVLGGDGTG
jgi:hypothetical protein